MEEEVDGSRWRLGTTDTEGTKCTLQSVYVDQTMYLLVLHHIDLQQTSAYAAPRAALSTHKFCCSLFSYNVSCVLQNGGRWALWLYRCCNRLLVYTQGRFKNFVGFFLTHRVYLHNVHSLRPPRVSTH
jgi:hypothetical protein